MSTTRPRKDSTVLAPIDVADQPVGTLIFLTEGTTGSQAFSVDHLYTTDTIARGERGGKLVIAVPIASPWAVIARDSMVLRTLEESMQKQKADREQEVALIKGIFGEDREPAPDAKSALPTVPTSAGHYM